MALPPTDTTNDAFVREVDEEFRRDQLLTLWQKYGKIAIGVIGGGLVLLAGWLWWQSHSESRSGKMGEQFEAAMKAQNTAELRKLGESGTEGYRALAQFAEADLLLANKDNKGAAAIYAKIAGDASLPQPFRDRALVAQTQAEFDTLKPEAVIDRLRGFADPASAWFGTAGEMVALSYLKQGKRAEAGKLLNQIATAKTGVPESIRQRAVQMAGVLGVYANDQSTEEKKAK